MQVTEKFVSKLAGIIDAGLCYGQGVPNPGEMCVEAAVCFAKGAPHGDQPSCVHPVLRSFMISLNDASWSSNSARAAGLKRLAIAQLGTAETFDGLAFATKMALYALNTLVPHALRSAASVHPDQEHREAPVALDWSALAQVSALSSLIDSVPRAPEMVLGLLRQ